MSLDEADTFFREAIGAKMSAAVFLDPKEAIDTVKEMIAIALAGDKVEIIIPFDENGAVNEDNEAVSKEDAEKYVEKYDVEESGGIGGIYQRCLYFCSDKEKLLGRTLWLETYKRVAGDYDAVDMLTWAN